MKYIDAEKLIAEIERQNVDKKVIEPLIRIINSLQQEQPSLPSNLDEAAEEYEHNLGYYECMNQWPSVAFKAGAEWMAGQGVIYDCRCVEAFQRAVGGAMNAQFPFKDLGLKDGDEVIIQIRKK